MIKCKEDLYNTYIVNDFGELRDKYKQVCEKFGINQYNKDTLRWEFLCVDESTNFTKFQGYINGEGMSLTQLTLADLEEDKPVIDLRGTKIDLRKPDGSVDEEKSRAFQEICFAQGYFPTTNKIIMYEHNKFAHVNYDGGLWFCTTTGHFKNMWYADEQIDLIPHITWEVVTVQPEKPRKTITIGGKTFYENDLISRCEGLQEAE